MITPIRGRWDLGRINLYGTGKRYPVTVSFCCETKGGNGKPQYEEFTASARAGAALGGQCLDEINEHREDFTPENRDKWDRVYWCWKRYHLNGLHAGTPEQEKAVKRLRELGVTDYSVICDQLVNIGLYEVEFTGMSVKKMYDHEPYKYGTDWLVEQIPEEGMEMIASLLYV